MRYQRVLWHHSLPSEPVYLYSECDDESWEKRKVEVFADGSMSLASEQEATGSTVLGEVPIPPLEEIGRDPQFKPTAITKEEFEVVWEKARQSQQNSHFRKAQGSSPRTPRVS